MPITCPKCQYIRPVDSTAPDWQCPACGVAYAKVGQNPAPFTPSRPYVAEPARRYPSWLGAALLLLAFGAVWWHFSNPHKGGILGALGFSQVDKSAVMVAAQKVQPTDIIVFTTDWCPSCKKMKAWLADYGFAYTECDIEKSKHCLDAWQEAGQRGVPYVTVKGQAYRDWWNAAALLDLLDIPIPTQQDESNR